MDPEIPLELRAAGQQDRRTRPRLAVCDDNMNAAALGFEARRAVRAVLEHDERAVDGFGKGRSGVHGASVLRTRESPLEAAIFEDETCTGRASGLALAGKAVSSSRRERARPRATHL
jgi:hypothetical protein